MGLIPLVAWTLFFIFLTILLCYSSIRSAQRQVCQTNAVIDPVAVEAIVTEHPSLKEAAQQLKLSGFTNLSALADLGRAAQDLVNSGRLLTDSEAYKQLIEQMQAIRNHQLAQDRLAHLYKHQPTRLVSQAFRLTM